jgi:hypothetical protein
MEVCTIAREQADDGVLAAHFGDDALDPDLAGLMPGRQFVDVQADIARTGEGNEAGFGMLHQDVAHGCAATGEEGEAGLGEAGFQ